MTHPNPDAAQWRQLSPLLDELLDLPPEQREQRLAQLRHEDQALGAHVAALLERLPPLDDAGFLDAPALPPPPGLQGLRIGAYRLVCELGQGGMGSVWRAERADGRYESLVAIKFMRGGWLGPDAAERFRREGQLLARLDHPHIARLLDAGVTSGEGPAAGQPYLVLEHVEGRPVDQWCDTQALDVTERVQLALKVAEAVAHAHSRRILHRDIKPSNILVKADGQPKLLDFGVGKLLADARQGMATGADGMPGAGTAALTTVPFTARCAAPEQVQGQDVTTATDVYGLGVLLYGLLGGGHPTPAGGPGLLAQMQAVVEAIPLRLSDAVERQGGTVGVHPLPLQRDSLDAILAKALQKAPSARYPDAAALAEDLRRWLSLQPVAASPIQATGQAPGQRAATAELMDFMLGDLRQRLTHLGRPELLHLVGEQALAHVAGSTQQAPGADALALRAKALRMIGESAYQRLAMDEASDALEQATQATAQLLALAPNHIPYLESHAENLEQLVYAKWLELDSPACLALCRQISTSRWRAAALAPHDLARQLRACDSDHWLVSVMNHTDLAAESLALLSTIHANISALSTDLPGTPRARAITLALTGQAHEMLGQYGEAVAILRAFLATQPASHEAVADATERLENLTVRRNLVSALLNQGRVREAVELAGQTAAHADRDAEQRPGTWSRPKAPSSAAHSWPKPCGWTASTGRRTNNFTRSTPRWHA